MKKRRSEVQNQFINLMIHQIGLVLVVICLFLSIMSLQKTEAPVLWGIPPVIMSNVFFVIMAVCIGLSIQTWRCPSCTRHLGDTIFPSACPKCGEELR